MNANRLSALVLAGALLVTTAFAQTKTNTFPDSGNVGIGTTSPIEPIDVKVAPDFHIGAFYHTPGAVSLGAFNDGFSSWRPLSINPGGPVWFLGGNIGIGTKNPSEKVTIAGDHGNTRIRLFSDHYQQGVEGANTALLSIWASEPGWTWTGTGIGNNVVNAGGIVRVAASRGASYMRLLDDRILLNTVDVQGTDRNAITINDGNVGIGTEPIGRFDVQGSFYTRGQGTIAVRPQNESVEGAELQLQGAGGNSAWIIDNYSTRLRLFTDGATTANSSQVQIFSCTAGSAAGLYVQGNVGIGTTNPTNKLEVNGTIRTKEVIVETTGWSDYVFAPDYRLAPLSEVEAHIQAKGTLPGIPSAAEVAEHGVSVGDMQAKLLAKVEELTLHVIALSKEVESLKAENAVLRTK